MTGQEPVPSGGQLPSRRALRAARAHGGRGVSAAAEQPQVVQLPDVGTTPLPAAVREDLLRPRIASSPGPASAPASAPAPGPAPSGPAGPGPADPRTGALRLAERARTSSAAARRRIVSTAPVSFEPADRVSVEHQGPAGSRVITSAEPGPRPDAAFPPSPFEPRPTPSPGLGEPVVTGGVLGEETLLIPRSAPEQPSRRRRARAGGEASGERAGQPGGRRPDRAGRNLPVAIAVGVGLAGAVLASLLIRKEAFVGLVSAAVVIALWEMAGALAAKKIQIPVIPLVVGALGMLVSAYVAREDGLLVAFTLTAFGVLLWRIIDGLAGAARDVAAGVFTAAYVPFLAGFAIVMLAAPDGAQRVLVYIAVTVASDIGGYAAGVLFGRHRMAPGISPKKSWEGFGGSALGCMVVATAGVVLLLHGPWWAGPALGAATAVAATLGDLSESLLKRDLGVKDMGSVLPGHGGMMDRIDSLLLTAPIAFVLLAQFVPAR